MASSYVRVYYGPCDSFHTVAHKPQKLRGLKGILQFDGKVSPRDDWHKRHNDTLLLWNSGAPTVLIDRLQRRGFRVDIVPVAYINYCMLEMCGHEVFRCNIKSLHFNLPFELDAVCQRAVAAVEESSAKLKRARCYLWFWTLLEKEMFKRSEFAPQDHWPERLRLDSLATCLECARCCNVLVSKKDGDHEA